MTAALAPAAPCPQLTDMRDGQAALQKVLEANPASIRTLAREAGVSEKLLRLVRDGERRLTPDVRDALVAALRGWERELGDASAALETADLSPQPGGENG